MILFNFCSVHWLIPWLLPFLLGLLAGWAIWARWKSMYADMEAKVSGLNKKVSGLEADLAACRKKRSELDGDLATTKGRIREVEADLAACRAARKDLEGKLAKASTAQKSAPKASIADVSTPSMSAGFAAASSEPATPATPATPAPSSPTPSIYAAIKDDNLQVIEGIGPKMESILKENGVNTTAHLASKSTAEVQAILNKYGDKYKIIDPGTWVQQAGLASTDKWEDLITLQKQLDTGRDNATNVTDSKVEKLLIKMGVIKSFKQDDLKAVEGIGPAIEKLMHAAGIKTWREMANSSVERLQKILADAGSRFKLADPGTWPKQAELAADGKYKELQEYQDFLQGGK